ncbi:MAG: redoxin family protein, partial [Phycisphaerae bacterium]|nr:redoxin family protein [Phycisphaerae bacterium]
MFIALFLGLSLSADVLKVGSAAPAMSTDSVVKGKDVKSFESGKVYVVEFWATWCPPCRAAVPHLTALQKQYPEITVIGVAGAELPSREGDRRLATVTDFVTTQGEKMNYTVLFDGDRSMFKDWMDAAKQSGIPCAFVVDGTGKVVHIGFPSAEVDAAVERAVAAQKQKKDSDAKKPSDSQRPSDPKKASDPKKPSDPKKDSGPGSKSNGTTGTP